MSGNSTACLKGTRVELLQEIEAWSARVDEGALPIYWLNGIPGTGKTTVAHTFAQVMFAEGRLGGSFFCSRDYTDRSNIRLIFPTIAFQLAYQVAEFRAALVETIRSQPNVGYQSLWDQLTKLIIDPLRSIELSSSTKSPIVIVLDALDECSDSKSVSVVLSLLSRHVASIPFVKIFITSRPESHIRNIFHSPLLHLTRELVLQDIDRATVDRDIEKYIRSALSELITERRNWKVTLPWPDMRDVKTLVQRSGGLFIHAFTTIQFISSRYHLPPTRLQLLLSIPHSTIHEGNTGIDRLYEGILVHLYKDADGRDVAAVLGSSTRGQLHLAGIQSNELYESSDTVGYGAGEHLDGLGPCTFHSPISTRRRRECTADHCFPQIIPRLSHRPISMQRHPILYRLSCISWRACGSMLRVDEDTAEEEPLRFATICHECRHRRPSCT